MGIIIIALACSVPGLAPSVNFHASLPRAKEEEVAPEATSSSWDPLYALPLGIAIAVPAIHYEWYLVNEETQVGDRICFRAVFQFFIFWILSARLCESNKNPNSVLMRH